MRNWDTRDESGTENGCEWKKDWADVQRVCRMLDIPCKMVRFVVVILSLFLLLTNGLGRLVPGVLVESV